ncbi:hypothetical protein MNBD_NITROSPINAE04-783 [hydrothermal vent metagenome]|uniref:FHA domain-containing protein n=2 Tax=hydrothermal vent metagenome TaxID=652676 RepID=A0A3B1C069_9ZZZZ
MASLTISSKDKVLKEVEIKKTLFVGREKGDIILKNPAVSARHFKLEKLGARFIIHDLNSTNGTIVNGEKVTTKELRSGDQIVVGQFVFKFNNPDQELGAVDSFGSDDIGGMTMMLDPAKVQAMMGEKPGEKEAPVEKESAKLFLYQSSGAPKVLKIEKDTTMIGSSENSDIQIKGITIGRIAASITKTGDKYEITYQGGMAKLKIDSAPVDKRQLENGDKFSIGSYNFEFRTEL